MSPFRLKTVTFTRQLNGAAIPILDLPGSRRSPVDWRRTAHGADRHAVAFARTATASISLDVEFEGRPAVHGTLRVRARPTGNGPLGNVAVEQIPVGELENRIHTFTVSKRDFSNWGLTSTSVDWEWEWSADGRHWQPFDQSHHDVFVLLDAPTGPWMRSRLWRDVLDRTCQWAGGADSVRRCTQEIVSGIYGLGGQAIAINNGTIKIGYNEASKFSRGERAYDLASFLDTAAVRAGSENMMNCLDCAGAVALLSSAVGCDLRVVMITPGNGRPKFETTPVRLIGTNRPRPTSFEFHAVNGMVAENGSLSDRVWDACLKLDVAPGRRETFQLALGMRRRANGTQAGYETQLIAQDEPAVTVQLGPGDGILSPVPVRDGVPMGAEPIAPPIPPTSPQADRIRERLFHDATISASEFHSQGHRHRLSIARVSARSKQGCDLHAWLVTTESPESAEHTFRAMAATVSVPMVKMNVCDSALHCENGQAVLVRRGTTVLRLVNDRRYDIDITAEASAFDKELAASDLT